MRLCSLVTQARRRAALGRALSDPAVDLLSHSVPSGDLSIVIEHALDLLIERVEKKRSAQTKLPRFSLRSKSSQSRVALTIGCSPSGSSAENSSQSESPSPRASLSGARERPHCGSAEPRPRRLDLRVEWSVTIPRSSKPGACPLPSLPAPQRDSREPPSAHAPILRAVIRRPCWLAPRVGSRALRVVPGNFRRRCARACARVGCNVGARSR